MDIVLHKGGNVSYHDPFIPNVKTHNAHTYHSIELTKENLNNADCVVLTTNHDVFDIPFIQQHTEIIVDMRNMIKEKSTNVIKL